AAAEESAPSFAWNVFIDNWRVIGPFPRSEKENGLAVDYLGGEASAAPSKPITWKGQTLSWTTWRETVGDFRRALALEGSAADFKVAYAWTCFTSPKAEEAILALGHKNGARVWFNGKEIYQEEFSTSATLDGAVVKVGLRQGRNTLLIKVTHRTGA